MKLLQTSKDGGPESTVWAHWLIELKGLFSIVLLRFEDGSRDAYHSHAFNCLSWVLRGELHEVRVGWDSPGLYEHRPNWIPFVTRRTHLHKVISHGRTWVLSFRGPWSKTWNEYMPESGEWVQLTHGRREINRS